jgi:hypothetical protein
MDLLFPQFRTRGALYELINFYFHLRIRSRVEQLIIVYCGCSSSKKLLLFHSSLSCTVQHEARDRGITNRANACTVKQGCKIFKISCILYCRVFKFLFRVCISCMINYLVYVSCILCIFCFWKSNMLYNIRVS